MESLPVVRYRPRRAGARSRRFRDVATVHSSIVETRRENFPRYVGSRSFPRVVNVFNFAARNVGRKVKFVHFSREDAAATTRADVELPCMARVLSKVVRSGSRKESADGVAAGGLHLSRRRPPCG